MPGCSVWPPCPCCRRTWPPPCPVAVRWKTRSRWGCRSFVGRTVGCAFPTRCVMRSRPSRWTLHVVGRWRAPTPRRASCTQRSTCCTMPATWMAWPKCSVAARGRNSRQPACRSHEWWQRCSAMTNWPATPTCWCCWRAPSNTATARCAAASSNSLTVPQQARTARPAERCWPSWPGTPAAAATSSRGSSSPTWRCTARHARRS